METDLLNAQEKRKHDVERTLSIVDKEGIAELLHWLDTEGYYSAPASTKYHNVYSGGLADHSWDVMSLLEQNNRQLHLELSWGTIQITGLLHDVCKVGLYIPDGDRYKSNKAHPKGHGQLSVEILKRFIELTELEEKMILYHMGLYGCNEFDERTGEYPLRGGGLANAWFHHPAVKVMYFCDELATLQEKARDNK